MQYNDQAFRIKNLRMRWSAAQNDWRAMHQTSGSQPRFRRNLWCPEKALRMLPISELAIYGVADQKRRRTTALDNRDDLNETE